MIYLDNAATTYMYPECLDSFKKYGVENFYNPSALYAQSVQNSIVVKNARDVILNGLKGEGDIIFTASGTEADNLAIFGTKKPKNSKIIVSSGEHSAVYNCAIELKNKGYNVLFAPVFSDGSLDLEAFDKIVDEDVCLVSVMHVNNETGAVNDLAEISKIIKKKAPKAVFHSDGVQGIFKVPVNLRALGVDLYSVSPHKFHGPKGVGALFIKKGIYLSPIIFGGGQEKGLRSATENVAGIDAFRVAFEKSLIDFNINYSKKIDLLKYLRDKVSTIEGTIILSPANSPHILSVAFKNVRGEVLMHSLERHNILVGIGSACSSKKGVNRFRELMLLDNEHAEGIIRISVSETNEKSEIDELMVALNTELKLLSKFKRK